MNQKLFFSDINTGKTLPKNCQNLSTSLKCFACIYYHWKKFLVQSVYVKRRTLISSYIAHTLARISCNMFFPGTNLLYCVNYNLKKINFFNVKTKSILLKAIHIFSKILMQKQHCQSQLDFLVLKSKIWIRKLIFINRRWTIIAQ